MCPLIGPGQSLALRIHHLYDAEQLRRSYDPKDRVHDRVPRRRRESAASPMPMTAITSETKVRP